MVDMSPSIRVLLVDDNLFFLRGLRSVLTEAGVEVAGEATDGARALDKCRSLRPDVVLLGIGRTSVDPIGGVRALAALSHVLVVSHVDDEDTVVGALAGGAHGYLVHGRFGIGELLRAVHSSARGEAHLSPSAAVAAIRLAQRQVSWVAGAIAGALSPREVELMDLVSRGLSNAQIAHQVFLAEKTVKNHLTRAFAKLGTHNRAEAAAIFTGRAGPTTPSTESEEPAL